jgi:type IV secretory pathway VirJ component
MNRLISIVTFLLFTLLFNIGGIAQNVTGVNDLPVNIVNASTDTSKPFVIYITGDGGWNKFSKNLTAALAGKGYPVVSLNAARYFWEKKTPQQTAADISKLITSYQRTWKRKNVLLVGYSFGADIMPFVYNLLSKDLASQVINISLLSPSAKTDFEIHLMVMLGGNSGGESVIAAINKISNKPFTFIFGEDEDNFPVKELIIKNFTSIKLSGGHHYDGDEMTVCNTILMYVPKK